MAIISEEFENSKVYNLDMSEDKARLERRVGISLKDKKTEPEAVGRRAFGKLAIATLAGVGGYRLIRALEEQRERGDEIFSEGFFGLFIGTIHVRKGAIIYDRPAAWRRSEPGGIITTNIREETSIETIDEGEEFKVENPILFFRPSSQLSTHTANLVQRGQEREVDLDASYVVFREEGGMPESVARSIERSVTKWGCVNMGEFDTLGYQPRGEEEFRFRFPPEAVVVK
jgi:hypothetical protein